MKVQITTLANEHLIEGYHFYEEQSDGLGRYFINSLYADIDSLRLSAGVHTVHFRKYYRLLSKRFPFAVYYKIKDDTAVVRAVLDCRRSPAWAKKKLS